MAFLVLGATPAQCRAVQGDLIMRKLIESTFVSLDGVIESPEKWTAPFFDTENKQHAYTELAQYDTFLLGRATYEKFAASWPKIHGDPYFDRINALPKLVASTTLRDVTWNATLIQGDVAAELWRLKRQPGKNIIKYGTGHLDRTLIQHGLIDELHFAIFPTVVGSGRRLFEGVDTSGLRLELVRTKTFANGVVWITYRPTV